MRRVIALMAAVLLVLAIAGPVAADPTVQQSQFPHVYVVTCSDEPPTEVPDQVAHGVPGWGFDWEPGDTPWLIMRYTVIDKDGKEVFVQAGKPGLLGNEKLFGPCTATWNSPLGNTIKDAYFLKR